MQTRQHYVDLYHEAMRREQDLWEKVKGRGPGQPGFDRETWKTWLAAVAATNAASKAMREAFSDDSKLGDLT